MNRTAPARRARLALALDSLARTLRAAVLAPRARWFSRDMTVQVGFETRADPAAYDWHGLNRGGDPDHPYIVFQYTLENFGHYADLAPPRPLTRRVEPGHAFVAVVPSAHRYYLPPGAPPWTFFWLILRQPYVVGRIAAAQRAAGAVLPVDPESLLASRAAQLAEGVARDQFADPLDLERASFDFLFEYERHTRALLHPEAPRDALLNAVRAYVLANLARPIDVAEIAAARGMSRSHFTHDFFRKTGRRPAAYITEIRLEEVSRRLSTTRDPLRLIASATGFADATHLCKVFRRRHHLTPAAFRRQSGS